MRELPDLSGQTVLVTGAGGYVGCVLVDLLLEQGAQIVALDRFFFGADLLDSAVTSNRVTLVRKDTRDLSAADFSGVDAVIDLAALSNDPVGDLDPNLTWSINSEGRQNVARAAKEAGVARFVLSSTCSIYGAAEAGLSVETGPCNPISTYAKSNYEAETVVLAMADANFTPVALRNATVFGLSRRMRFDLVVNLMTLRAFESGMITIMGGGKQWRPLVHVKDVARGLILALDAPADIVSGRIYNIGMGNFQVRTVAAIVRESLPFQVQLQVAPDDADKRNYRVSFERIGKDLGFEPSMSLQDGINEVYEALKMGEVENSPKCSTVTWYKHLLEAKRLIAEIELNGRLL